MRRLRRYVRGLDPRLPRSVWTMEIGGFANAFGNGLAFPFLLIYLHNVRGFSLPMVGLIAATSAAAGIVTVPIAGIIVDRFGGKRTLIVSLVVLAIGFGGYALVREPWQAFLFAAVGGIGNGAFWPSQSALITGLAPQARRHAAFALQRVMRNLGVGLGGVAGGLIATTENATSYTVLFTLDALTFLAFIVALAFVPDPGLSRSESEQPGHYREVLRDRVFLGVVGLNLLYVAAGYAQLEVFPVFAKNEAGISERQIGLIFFANTLAIVVAQLPFVKVLEGRRRMPALALMTLLWAVAWMIVFGGGLWAEGVSAALVFGIAFVIFGLGECMHGPDPGRARRRSRAAALARPLHGSFHALLGGGLRDRARYGRFRPRLASARPLAAGRGGVPRRRGRRAAARAKAAARASAHALLAEPPAAGSLDPDDVAGGQVTCHLGGQLLAVQEIAPGSARQAALGSLRAMGPPLRDHREAAGLEDAELPDDPVAAAVSPRSAGLHAKLVALHAQWVGELQRLGRRRQRVRHGHVHARGAIRLCAGALAAADRLVVRKAIVPEGDVVHRALTLRGNR